MSRNLLWAAFAVAAAALALVFWLLRPAPVAPAASGLSAPALLGARLFADESLSASGRLACATCHVPEHAHSASDGLPAPLGGVQMASMGFRNAPTLRYLATNTAFFFDDEGTPTGGFNLDGRAKDFAEQVSGPLFAPHEMALKGPDELLQRLRAAPYADEFRRAFGADALDDAATALRHAGAALAAFQTEDPQFHPFDSKYDFYLAGRVPLSEQEMRGLKLFEDENKGNCAACHPSRPDAQGRPPLFTDFTYDVLGVPRNPKIAATADPKYFDLGLCGPDRRDLAARRDLCGAFKVPTLRNVVNTAPYFHNGRFDRLEDVVAFYVRRDTNPEQWYPKAADGRVLKYDDLPAEHHANVNLEEKPYDRKPGDAPALTADEIRDVVAFLKTLTDGYTPP